MKGSTSRLKKPTTKLIKGKEPGDWRERRLDNLRQLIMEADPRIVEERKWKKPSNPDGIPVWYRNGMICTGEVYKDHLKLTFAKGASLDDPSHLFTQPGTVRRGIDIHEGESINETAFKDLVRAAVALNESSASE
jgi:hypothetical protein